MNIPKKFVFYYWQLYTFVYQGNLGDPMFPAIKFEIN